MPSEAFATSMKIMIRADRAMHDVAQTTFREFENDRPIVP